MDRDGWKHRELQRLMDRDKTDWKQHYRDGPTERQQRTKEVDGQGGNRRRMTEVDRWKATEADVE